MTAVWIILGILAVLALLLSVSATVTVSIGEETRVWVGACGIRYPVDLAGEKQEKPPKKKEAKPKAEQAPAAEKKPKPDEKTFGQTVELAIQLLQSILPPAVRMLSHLRFTSVRIDVSVGTDEADQTAIQYGAISAGIYNLLGALDSLFTLKVKSVDIRPDFVTGESSYRIFFKVKLRLWHILSAGVGMFFKFIAHTMSGSKAGGGSSPPAGTASAEAE